MTDFLLDCNHLAAAVRRVAPVRERLHQARRAGHRLICSYAVLCELEAGIQQTADPDEYRRRFILLFRQLRWWPFDPDTAQLYGAVFNEPSALETLDQLRSSLDYEQWYRAQRQRRQSFRDANQDRTLLLEWVRRFQHPAVSLVSPR